MMGRLLILFALVLSGAATLYYVAFSNPAESVQPPTVKVRIAAAPLRTGTFLDPDDAPLTERPEWPGMDDFLMEGDADMLGAVVIAPVAAGAPVPRTALLAPNQDGFLAAVLAPGMRAASIGVDAVSGNAGHIFPGDRVDLLLTQQAERDGRRDWATETILRNVRVIAVDQRLNEDPAARTAENVARTITLEVTPRDAERMALARNLGRLSLTLRSFVTEQHHQNGADDRDGPVWSGDISSVLRDMMRDRPEQSAQIPAAPDALAPPSPILRQERQERPVTVLRGSGSSKVTPTAPQTDSFGALGAINPQDLGAIDPENAFEALQALQQMRRPN